MSSVVTMALCLVSFSYARASFDSWIQFLSQENNIAQAKLSFGEGKEEAAKVFQAMWMGSRTSFHSCLEGRQHESSSRKLFCTEICSVLFELRSKLVI